MKKRWISFLSLLLALCLLLSSCTAGTGEVTLFGRIGDAISGFFGRATNLLSGNTPLLLNGQA